MSELRKYLKTVDAGLAEQLGQVWKKAEAGIHEAIHTKEGHIGGKVHSDAVEHNVWRLIPKEWRGTDQCRPIDLFLLSAAAALHDAGRVPFGGDFDPDLDHGQLSEKRIRANPGKFELSQHEADVVGMVVRPHNDGDLSTLEPEGWALSPHGLIDVRKLAALLRLGDILHIAGRVSPQVIDSSELTGRERAKTLFRELVADWDVVHDGQAIRLFASTATTEEYDVVFGGVEVTARDLEPIAAALESCGLPHRFTTPKVNTDKMKWAEEERAKDARALIGLDYFHENDAEAFKGRDNEIAELQQRVIGNHVSLLVGASGAGKTSLILAGLFPKLKRAGWKCVHTRPWISANTIVRREEFEDLLGYVPTDETSLALIVEKAASVCGQEEVLICIDQFEDASQLIPFQEGRDFRRALSMVQSHRFRNIHLLIAYRVEGESAFGRLWQGVAGSAAGLPRMYINPLDRHGAQHALADTLARSRIGLQPHDALMELILDDLESETRRQGYVTGIYPPYVRMIAQTIIAGLDGTGGVFHQESYKNLGGAGRIIGDYLLETLDHLGSSKADARKILETLTSTSGAKSPKPLTGITAETGLGVSKVVSLLLELAKLRLVRQVGAEYEIAHDCLAYLVWQRLLEDDSDEVEFRTLRDMLAAKARLHVSTGQLPRLEDEPERLYDRRERVVLSEEEQSFLFRRLIIAIADSPRPGWFWLRDWSESRVFSELESILTAGEPDTSCAALHIMGDIGTRDHLSHIKPMLYEQQFKLSAVGAFCKLASTDDLGAVERLCQDSDLDVRRLAAKTLARLARRPDIGFVQTLLMSPDWRVFDSGSRAFSRLVTRDDLPKIKLMLGFPGQTRYAALDAFAHIGNRSDLSRISPLLYDHDAEVKVRAIKAFVSLGTHRDWPAIARLIASSTPRVQVAAVRAFISLGAHEEISVIQQLILEEVDDEVRAAAFDVVAAVGSREDLLAIEDFLTDYGPLVRRAAVTALGKLGSHDDLPLVLKSMLDTEETVRDAAVGAFAALATHDDVKALTQLLSHHTRPEVRKSAIQAFGHVCRKTDLSKLENLIRYDTEDNAMAAAGVLCGTAGRRKLEQILRYSFSFPRAVLELLDRTAYMPKSLRPAFGSDNDGSRLLA